MKRKIIATTIDEKQLLKFWNKKTNDLQCTWTFILLDTDGGTLFDAMHKYAPISDLVIFVSDNISPSTWCAGIEIISNEFAR